MPDVLDLLDEDVIRSHVNWHFPGHALARKEFERERGGNEAAYKEFLWRQYNVPTTERGLRKIARLMHGEGRPRTSSPSDFQG